MISLSQLRLSLNNNMKQLYFCFTLILLLLFTQVAAFAQNSGTISGTVKTSDGKPASYVNVELIDTHKRIVTDKKGAYSFKNIKAGNYILRVSAIGINTQEKAIEFYTGNLFTLNFYISQSSSQLKEVNINGAKTQNQKPVSLSKIDLAPKDLPQAVQIIGTQVIKNQQINRLSDVMKNVNGVALGANRGSVNENFYARGYSLGANNVFKNGVRTTLGGMPEASTLEAVEVLKGSAALLYGGVTGGAVVNMVTKKPQFEYGGEVSLRAGSYGLWKPIADLYGPISKKLAFRVISTYEKADSYRDVAQSERFYVNPSLLYRISDKTELTLQGDYLKSNFTPDFGIGTVANAISPLPRNAYINTPWAYNNTNTVTSQISLNHQLNDNWKINASASLQAYNRNYFSAERPFANAKGLVPRNLTRSKTKEFTYNEQLNLNGTFHTGALKHTLLVGLDADQSNTNAYGFAYADGKTAYNYGDFNLLNPATYNTRSDIPVTNIITDTYTPIYRMGAFVQDMVALTDQFKVLAGIRWSFQKTPTTTINKVLDQTVIKGTAADKIDKAYSPKLGLIYQPIKTTSLYVSYANNFTSNAGRDIYDVPMGPSIIDQYEAGIKNDFLEGKLTANVTWYKIINDRFAQQAILNAARNANADANIKEFSGKSASDGIELDITGTIAEGLSFLAGYSYNYMRYTDTKDSSGIVEGERLVGTTKNTANGTVFYTLSSGALKGLKLGASAFYTGDRNGGRNTNKAGTTSGIIPIKGFTTVDLSAGYCWKKLSILGKISNLTNELNYYVHENYSVNPIPPRQFIATLAYKFGGPW
ncbi:iron complex outermembrane receptor protein [Pedobacter sp. CG_S7]